MAERYTEHMRLRDLEGNPQNAKGHDVLGIQESMRRFGMVDLIVLDERTQRIVSGHGRRDSLLALEAAGGNPPDEDIASVDGAWWVPVVRGWASADDDDAAAAAVAVNQWSIAGGWDLGTLLPQLDRLGKTPAGLAGVGFGDEDLDDMLARFQEQTALPDDNAEDWTVDGSRQVRSIMLDYPLDDYRWVADTASRARTHYGVASNAELFVRLVRDDNAA